jgi:hypothetical protein
LPKQRQEAAKNDTSYYAAACHESAILNYTLAIVKLT